jgi:hypothetical protein
MKSLVQKGGSNRSEPPPNTASTQSPATNAGAMVLGLPLRGVRVFKHFAWLEAGSVKATLSRPAHQYPEGA